MDLLDSHRARHAGLAVDAEQLTLDRLRAPAYHRQHRRPGAAQADTEQIGMPERQCIAKHRQKRLAAY